MDTSVEKDLDEAIRHTTAGLRALEAARDRATETGRVYPTHLYLASVELVHAAEVATRLGLRNQ